jgi:DNA helicase-2/ATP-dependent DNA helicase PcrA
VCSAVLASGAERKVGRCSSCPPTYDEKLFEALREWRSRTAAEAKVPAYVVFTDATLVAVAENTPGDKAALARIPGTGPTKLDRYADDLLAVLSAHQPSS